MRISAYTPRAIWRRHMLYNRTGMRLLSTFNHLRWRTIDIPVLLWPPAHEFFGMIEAEIRAEEQIVAASDHLIRSASRNSSSGSTPLILQAREKSHSK
jgi:hypothetical protein